MKGSNPLFTFTALINNLNTYIMNYKLTFFFELNIGESPVLTGTFKSADIKNEILEHFIKSDAIMCTLELTQNGKSLTYQISYDESGRIAVYNHGSEQRLSIPNMFDILDRYQRTIDVFEGV